MAECIDIISSSDDNVDLMESKVEVKEESQEMKVLCYFLLYN